MDASTELRPPLLADRAAPGRLSLDGILAPVTREEFLADTWDRRPLVVQRASPEHYAGLLSVSDFDRLLSASVVESRDARIVREGRSDGTAAVFGPDGRANIAALHSAYARGFTVVVNNVHKRRPEVAALCRDIELALGHPVGANAYLTPPRAQGLAPHFDNHDVFVLQLSGRKGWKVFEPEIERPLPEQHRDVSPDAIGEPVRAVVLDAGDLLYLPRGVVHQAESLSVASLHLTIGIRITPVAAILSRALADEAARDGRLRRAVPPGALDAPAAAAELEAELRALLRGLVDRADLAQALEQLRVHFVAQMDPLPDGGFGDVDRLGEVGLDSRLRRRAGSACAVVETGAEARIEFPGNAIGGPPALAGALRFVAATERFTPRELPSGLTDESKLLLVRRLVSAGLLVIDA